MKWKMTLNDPPVSTTGLLALQASTELNRHATSHLDYSVLGSNSGHGACYRNILPTELQPHWLRLHRTIKVYGCPALSLWNKLLREERTFLDGRVQAPGHSFFPLLSTLLDVGIEPLTLVFLAQL